MNTPDTVMTAIHLARPLRGQDDPEVIAALQDYLGHIESGTKPNRAEFLSRYPAIAGVLAECMDAIDFVHTAASDLSAGVSQPPPGSAELRDPQGAGCLGDFRLVREIGRGGMGIVYEAEQLSLRRRVALKVLPFAGMMDSKQLLRFQNEAHAAAQLHHQNIVPVYFVGNERGVHYYAMQFIEGHTLADLIRELRRDHKQSQPEGSIADSALPNDSTLTNATFQALSTARTVKPIEFFRTVVRLGIEAAEALDHAHQVGIIHRDIKPSNLLLDVRGQVWLTDFGLARILSPDDRDSRRDSRDLTVTGDLIGTLRYMSPEQALAKRIVVDHRTDVYSLGVTLYELLTLRPVFSGQDRHEILRQIAFDEPRPPRHVNPGIPLEIETIVLKAISKNPSERYGTAQEFADDLRRHLDNKSILARRPGLVRRLVKWSSRHRAVVWSAAATIVASFGVLAGSAGWIMSDREWRQNETEREVHQAVEEAASFMIRANWLEARTAVSRADGLLVTGPASDELRRRVHQLHADFQMIDRLHAIREFDAAMLDGVHDYQVLDQRYEEVFRGYGIDFSTLPVEHAAKAIEHQIIASELIAGLDHWALVRHRNGNDPSSILAVARSVDSDELRNRIRDCFEHGDGDGLLDASASADTSALVPASAVLLASTLSETGNVRQAVTVLETAHDRNPRDLRVALLLAENLHDLAQWDDMRRVAHAARSLEPTSGAALLSIADALRHKGSSQDAIGLCEQVIELNPANPHAYELLGLAHEDLREWDLAVTHFRKAIELHPTYVEAYNHLGRCLFRKRDYESAIRELKAAIALKPQYAGPHENLGLALWQMQRVDEAISALERAIELDPASAQARTDLGAILVRQGRIREGIEKHLQAVGVNPNHAEAHINLGNAYKFRKELDLATSAYGRAIELKPQLAVAHWCLAQTFMDQGNFADALVTLRHGDHENLQDKYGPYPWSDRLRDCERMIELERSLTDVLAAPESIERPRDRADYAMLCYYKRLYLAATRLYERAFAKEPAITDDSKRGHRYIAACSAALASAGQGDDSEAAALDDPHRRHLRECAFNWLRAELGQYADVLENGDSKQRGLIIAKLPHWLVDPDLASVRDEESLARLPEAERAPWETLWRNVAQLLRQDGN